jgi:hypothetical protein
MNRLTAIGLASLVAYGLLIASKYTGVVSAARDERVPQAVPFEARETTGKSMVVAMNPEPRQAVVLFPPPVARVEPPRLSPAAIEFRASRDLKAFADGMAARRASLTGDERYHLAKALEECQFATTINEDLAAYSAKQKRQFLASLPAGDPINDKRIAAYEAVDNTQRCIGFQNTRISPKDIEELYRAAAMQGDPRAQARLLVAELGKNNAGSRSDLQNVRSPLETTDQFTQMVRLLESKDPEALLTVGGWLATQAPALRVGPRGEAPEPSAFLGGFSLAACDLGQDCSPTHRDLQQACAYGSYCNAQSFQELYQTYQASPWAWSQARGYQDMIHIAIATQNWALIGLVPPTSSPSSPSSPAAPQGR